MSGSKLTKIGKYDVLDILGRGGMGVIYKAIDPAIGRMVAIKMITGAFSEDPDLLKRFYREAQSTGTLQHPNIVTVYELGDLEGMPYLVMEFLDGEGLDKAITQKRPIPLVEKLAMGVQVCQGLSYAHQRGVIHRDIKPANIVVLQNGSIKIVDFGIARIGNDQLTKPGQVVGSIHYMSPEQINAVPVDSRSDIFSTGVLLYELFTYTLPFQGRDTFNTLMKILNQEAPPLNTLVPELPPELNEIVQQALAKDRDLRYPSIDDLSFDLSRVLDRLKEEIISGYLSQAETYIKNSDWTKAREQISSIFRIDRQNTRANMLNREISAAMQKAQVQAQIKEHRAHAEQAFSQHRYDEALASLDHALALRKTDPTIIRFRDSVEAAREKAIQLSNALNRAHTFHESGDLEGATNALNQALAIDSNNPEAKALLTIVRREQEERARQREIEHCLEQGRKQMALRQYATALESLKRAEQLDPASPKIHELIQQANASIEQERRRKQLESLCGEIEDLLNHDDFGNACTKAEQALKLFPDDRGLIKLKDLAVKQREMKVRRDFVDSQIRAARQLLDAKKSSEALAVVQKGLQRYPDDAALRSQLTMVNETITREREEARRAQFVSKAKDALRRRDYTEAIATLESAQKEFQSSEVDDLLQLAREKAAAVARQKRISQVIQQAQQLLDAEEYQQAIQVLEKAVVEISDDELQLRLVEARNAAENFNHRINEAIFLADRLLGSWKPNEAVKHLESQPKSFSRLPEFVAIVDRAHKEQARAKKFEQASDQIRPALESADFAQAFQLLESVRVECGTLPGFVQLESEMQSARLAKANSEIEKAIHDARLVLLVRSFDAAIKLLDDASGLLEYANPELRTQFEILKRDAVEGKQRQEREAKQRPAISTATEQVSTRVVGSSNTNVDDMHWSSAATATPIPQELTRLEASILRERDLMKLRDLLTRCESASPDDCGLIEEQTESLSELYSDDPEFEELVSEVLDRLAEIERKAHAAPPELAQPVPSTIVIEPEPSKSKEEERPVAEAATIIEAQPVERTVALPSEAQVDSPIEATVAAVPVIGESALIPPPTEQQITPSVEPAVLEPIKPVTAVPAQAPPPEIPRKTSPEEPKKAKKAKKSAASATPTRKQEAAPATIAPAPKTTATPTAAKQTARPQITPSEILKGRNLYYIGGAVLALVVIVVVILLNHGSTPHPSAPASTAVAPALTPVKINSMPAQATVRVQDQTCTTPNCDLNLAPGTYDVTAELSGYDPIHEELTIKPGEQNRSMLLTLTPTSKANDTPRETETAKATSPAPNPPKPTSIELTGLPANTAVKIDGSSVGQTGANGTLSVDVKPGAHNIELTHEGYRPLKVRRRVALEQTLQLGTSDLKFAALPQAIVLKNQPPAKQQQAPSIAMNNEPSASAVKIPAPPAPAPPDPSAADWEKIANTRDQSALSDFLRKYPGSPHAAEASHKLEDLRNEAARAAAANDLTASRAAIEQTLSRYAQAYRDRNVNAVTAVWPGLSKSDIKRIDDSFKAASSVQMNLRPTKEPEVNGDRATVICSRSLQYVFRQGEAKPLQDTVTVQMRKQNGLWVIEKVE